MLQISFIINNKRTGNTYANLIIDISQQRPLFLITNTVCSTLYHFHQNLQKIYNSNFEKQFHQHLNFRFSLHLKQWQISKQINSMIEVHYAQIKRNPE